MEAEAFAALERGDGHNALEIFKGLAALGSGVADYCVGDIYLHGQGGVPHDPAEAKKWYEKAFASSIEKLSQYAGIKLGYIYEAGYDEANRFGAAIDDEKAFYYYQRAENSDIAIGLLRLGIMYAMGKGTKKDLSKAESLYRRAAGRHVVALKNLGVLKVQTGNVPYGLLLWGSAIAEGLFLGIFKRNSLRLAML
jgi:TPR repeat protein